MGCGESRNGEEWNQRIIDNLHEISRVLHALKPQSKSLYELYFKIQASIEKELLTNKDLECEKDDVLKKTIKLMEENEQLSDLINTLKAENNQESSEGVLEMEELNLELQNTKKEKQFYESTEEEIVLNNVFTISRSKVNVIALRAFLIWKSIISPKSEFVRRKRRQKTVLIVKKLKAFEDQNLLDVNELLKKSQEREFKNAKPLDLGYTFKFLEKLMDDKFDEDTKVIEEGKIPRELSDFLIEQIFARYDSEEPAYKFLNELVASLHSLFKMNQTYGILFCRLFNLFHSQPIPYRLVIYITQARMYFQQLKQLKPIADTPGSIVKGFLEDSYGGESLLSDVIMLIELLFKEDQIAGAKVLEKCRPNSVGIGEYCLYIVCNKFFSENIDVDEWIESLGAGESVQYPVIARKLLKTEVWATEEMIYQMLLGILNNKAASKSDLRSLLAIERYVDGYTHQKYLINKASFMNAIVTVYDELWTEEGVRLYMEFVATDEENGLLTERMFVEKCFELELSIPHYELENLYREVATEEGITGEAAYKQVLKRLQYGAFNVFNMPNFESFSFQTRERKTLMGDKRPSISSLSFPISRLTI